MSTFLELNSQTASRNAFTRIPQLDEGMHVQLIKDLSQNLSNNSLKELIHFFEQQL